jgi:hypothetical protein
VATFYLRPHDGALAIGPFTTSDDAATFYHTNMDLSGCDLVEAIDQSAWPTPGNSLFYRFEFQEPPGTVP